MNQRERDVDAGHDITTPRTVSTGGVPSGRATRLYALSVDDGVIVERTHIVTIGPCAFSFTDACG